MMKLEYKEIDKSQYTPMMQQYLDIKKDYKDTIVFFRLGDFYEMFFNDALVASRELEIALTGRDAGASERVPMCGIPFHACNTYIEKLVAKGYKIAIVEQVEDPKSVKAIVKRDVVRLITPGTLIEQGLDDKINNYLISVIEDNKKYIFSYADVSTGEIYLTEISTDDLLINEILSLKCREIIVLSSFNKDLANKLLQNFQICVSYYDVIEIPDYLNYLMEDISNKNYYKGIGLLINYILNTQRQELTHLKKVEIYEANRFLQIDVHSRRNLELTETLRNNQKNGSLLWLLDKCSTALGSRYLYKMLQRPLLDYKEINQRLDAVSALMNNYIIRYDIKETLKTVYDLERIVGRISCGNANAKDLVQLRRSLLNMPELKRLVRLLNDDTLNSLSDEIDLMEDLTTILSKALVDNPPLTIKEGGMIKSGYNDVLDQLLDVTKNGKDWLINYEMQEREKTQIKNLKVGYNRVFGYYIEISKANNALIKDEFGYERRQTLANSERFITKELKEHENLVLGASDKILKLEYELFVEIREFSKKFIKQLQELSNIVALIDVLCSFADVSEENNYVRPTFTLNRNLTVIEGRHPVIEKILENNYVANDIYINSYNLLLITGPNMSGKSTYMRQLALTIIMAQIGCFVPASKAELPLYDKIFTRIGASDDLVSGQSTFMVEMLETNYALTNATKNSLILLDEIGRGTATYDGMALAQAIIEYIHEKLGTTTIFSTHYHELTALENKLSHLKNIHVEAKEEKDGVVFLHKVLDGPQDKSYGINVASLAKLPKPLIRRATDILNHFESTSVKENINLDLFNFDEINEIKQDAKDPLIEEIKDLDINEMTPLECMTYLSNLQKKLIKG